MYINIFSLLAIPYWLFPSGYITPYGTSRGSSPCFTTMYGYCPLPVAYCQHFHREYNIYIYIYIYFQ